MKKLSMLNIKQINSQYSNEHKKFSSFDILSKSPYKSTFHRQQQPRQPIKEYFPISTRANGQLSVRSPMQVKKPNKPFSISNATKEDLQSPSRYLPDSSRRMSKKSNINQLKNILGKEKLSPTDLAQRLTTQIQQIPHSPKKNLKTSPDNRFQFANDNLKIRQQIKVGKTINNNNKSERLQLEQTKQKIQQLQMRISGNIQSRISKDLPNFFSDKKIIVQKQQIIEEKLEFPLTPQSTLKYYGKELTDFEKNEIIEYDSIYYIGNKTVKQQQQQSDENFSNNDGFDTTNGDYKFIKEDHIAYRYELVDKLGHGSFGYVFKVIDHKHHQTMALKIIKNREKFYNQALIEIDILKVVNQADQSSCLIKMLNYFEFRNHICMVFELLSCNLYEFIAINDFTGFDLDLIRRFSIQILQALLFLKDQNIIHCDLKPENILLKDFNRSGLKVIDFGSSCFINQKMYTYIQSRFYRSPEIVFGIPYTTQIDMWSFGCIVAELFTGQSLFQSKSEKELLYLQVKVLGKPSDSIINSSPRKDKFFDEKNQLLFKPKDLEILLQIKPLKQQLSQSSDNFYDFINKCLQWNPKDRLTPEDALIHPWILEGLPSNIKKQHITQMKQIQSLHFEISDNQGQGEQLD